MYQLSETKGEAGAPLVFTFHGTGGSPDQFHGLARDLVDGAHVISPAGDVSEHGAARFFRRTAEGVYDMDDLRMRTIQMRRFIASAVDRVKPTSVAGVGYSNGANILAAVVLDGPRLFDAVALMHPLIPWQPAANPAIAGTRILITAGRADPICPPAMTQRLADDLAAPGAAVDLRRHSGGHAILPEEVSALRAHLAVGAV